MKAEECPRLDECMSVRSLRCHEWASEADLAAAIRELCETCPTGRLSTVLGRIDFLREEPRHLPTESERTEPRSLQETLKFLRERPQSFSGNESKEAEQANLAAAIQEFCETCPLRVPREDN